jgi:uncharacterized repeat protein (TIGR03803 family)
MKLSALSLCAFIACCSTISACSQATEFSRLQYTPNINDVPDRVAKSPSYRVLYDFGNPPDGNIPEAALIDMDGTLYGTTVLGGAPSCFAGGTCGTVFSIATSGTEKVLYRFEGDDGASPEAPLIDVKGTLYGTTDGGGPNGLFGGTVFSITTSGSEKVLHTFGTPPDGGNPYAPLIDVKGTLYGTTDRGGSNYCTPYGGCGTVFTITTDGAEKVLHSFGDKKGGDFPAAGLIDVGGTLYGTTSGGGAYAEKQAPYEGGVVFSITTGGKEKVLHSFGKGTDGHFPVAGLIDVKGTLYGTTQSGGTALNGTVFSITTGGKEKVLHNFGVGTKEHGDGVLPMASLIDANGTLYGTTSEGGDYNYGTIFSITTSGKETVLHSFGKLPDGAYPQAGLLDVHGTLYGTTTGGGKYYGSEGYGTVFALTL